MTLSPLAIATLGLALVPLQPLAVATEGFIVADVDTGTRGHVVLAAVVPYHVTVSDGCPDEL